MGRTARNLALTAALFFLLGEPASSADAQALAAARPASPASRPAVRRAPTRKPALPAVKPPDRTHPPGAASPAALHLPPVQTARLMNGLLIAVVEMHEAPVVDVTLTLDAGAIHDPADRPGLATFTAGMLDEGAGSRGALDIAEQADFLGANLTTRAGADRAEINLHIPKRGLAAGLDLMADVALRPTFPDSEITRQRELRLTGLLQLRDQPTQIAPIAFNAIVFGDQHPYGRPLGGTEASTRAITHDEVARFFTTYYRPNTCRLLIVGDITLPEARALIEARFSDWSQDTPPVVPFPLPAPAAPRRLYLVDKPGAAQSVVRIGQLGVPRSTNDYFALEVLNTLLGGSFSSRLNRNLRETHGYTYGAGSAFDMRLFAGPFRASASVVTAKTDSSVLEFMSELRRIREEPVPAEELTKAKDYIALGLPSQFETTAGTAEQVLELLENKLPLQYYDGYIEKIQAVTAREVQDAARRYLDPDRFVIVVVGDRSKIESGLKALALGPVEVRDLWGHPVQP
jgi:zinc protease